MLQNDYLIQKFSCHLVQKNFNHQRVIKKPAPTAMIVSTSFLPLSLLNDGNTSDGCPSDHCPSCYKKPFLKSLSLKERYHHQWRIPRNALLTVTKSPWHKLCQYCKDQAMKAFTGFDARHFDYVLEKFANMFDAFTPFLDGKITLLKQNTCGHMRMIHPEDCLGLVLAWTRTCGSLMKFQLIFGMSVSKLLMYLCFGCWLMLEIVNPHHLAEISAQSKEKIKEYKLAIHAKDSHL